MTWWGEIIWRGEIIKWGEIIQWGEIIRWGEIILFFFMYLFRVLEHSKHFINFFLFASEIPGTFFQKSDYFEKNLKCQQNGT